jgi:hypothetical protein
MFPKRIILSRKGFDGTAGGCPSPIFQDGTMFSIPIPENGKHKVRTRYEDLGQQGGYQFPKKLVTSSGRGIPLSGQVHLDPDIRPSLRPSFAAADCSSTLLYGQDGSSQTHLENEGVGEDDLFLFFGLFRRATCKDDSAYFERSSRQAHVIWGWLQVSNRFRLQRGQLPESLKSATHHPHLDYRDRDINCMYVGSPSLSFCDNVAGAGIFDRYDDALRLTSLDEYRCSHWTLPSFFAKAGMTYHSLQAWDRRGELIRGQAVGRGQEFVMKTDSVEQEARVWLNSLFRHAKRVD